MIFPSSMVGILFLSCCFNLQVLCDVLRLACHELGSSFVHYLKNYDCYLQIRCACMCEEKIVYLYCSSIVCVLSYDRLKTCSLTSSMNNHLSGYSSSWGWKLYSKSCTCKSRRLAASWHKSFGSYQWSL